MASHARISRPGQPFSYETPEQKARDVLRGQKTIANTMQRADQHAQSIAALTALAKGVPANELPPGGIHAQMSPADVQAATDRINAYRARTGQGAAGPVGATGQPFTTPSGGTIAGRVTQDAQGNPVPAAGQTRRTPTGGTETLVQSESGPRWVASVNNAPAPNNLNGQVSRDPGGRTAQVQPTPVGAPVTGPAGNRATDRAGFQANLAVAQNPTQPVQPRPFSYEQAAPSVVAAAGTGQNVAPRGQVAYSTPAAPPIAKTVPITSPTGIVPPIPQTPAAPTGPTNPMTSPSRGNVATPGTPMAVPAPQPMATVPPPTPAKLPALDDEEEQKRRQASAATGSQPYQFA